MLKQYCRFAKAVEPESKKCRSVGEKRREERKGNSEKIKDIPATKKVALESASKVADTFVARF